MAIMHSTLIVNRSLLFSLIAFLIHASGMPVRAQSTVVAEFAVHTGKHQRLNTPLTASLQSVSNRWDAGGMQLYEITDGKHEAVASQITGAALTWILSGKSSPGSVRTYALEKLETPSESYETPPVRVDDDGRNLNIKIGGKPVLSYRYAVQPVPEGVDSIFSRQGAFIHPLVSPEGEILSRIQPPDHYHHYGVWNPWTSTVFEGREIDFWNLVKGEGTVRSAGLSERTAGPITGRFKAQLDHIDLKAPGGEKAALHEEWDVTAWNADPDQKIWVVDFVSTLNPATVEPLTIKAYRYQGFSLRATEKWNDENAVLLTSEGYDKSDGNATRARWIDVNGVSAVPEGASGVLFLTHPANHNFPEQLRIWPVGTNGGVENVYINFNPAQEEDWVLEPGRAYSLRYRMILYDGKMSAEQAEMYWANFAEPPRIEVFPIQNLAGARVLVYTKNGEGYVHENIPASVEALRKLGNENGFSVDVSDNPADFTAENLSRYDALIFSNTNNEAFETPAQREALKSYIEDGGGFVGIHSASGSERDWPWFSKLIGGNFERHAPRQDFTVSVIDRSHPSTSFLPNSWAIEDDECYYLDELNPAIRVLLASDLNSVSDDRAEEFPGNLFGDQFPVSWYQEFDGGRQWYTSLGHRPEHYRNDQFMRHILGGIQWVVNGVSP